MMSESEKDSLYNQCLLEFQLNPISIREVYDSALEYLNETRSKKAKAPLKQEVWEDRIKRLMVNDIRHKYTNYDEELQKMKKLKRTDETYYYLYKNYALSKIQEQYKYLENECKQQKTNLILAKRV